MSDGRRERKPLKASEGGQARMAAGSHHTPTPWPWLTRWAGGGRSCNSGEAGVYSVEHLFATSPRLL